MKLYHQMLWEKDVLRHIFCICSKLAPFPPFEKIIYLNRLFYEATITLCCLFYQSGGQDYGLWPPLFVSKEMELVVKSVGLTSFYRHGGDTWKDQRH